MLITRSSSKRTIYKNNKILVLEKLSNNFETDIIKSIKLVINKSILQLLSDELLKFSDDSNTKRRLII